jgi:UDP-N-acetylbacillosamine N-acetyltransferase
MNREAICQQLIVLGFGGHARSVADVAVAIGYKSLVFVDEQARKGEMFLGFPVLKSFTPSYDDVWHAFPASGKDFVRQTQIALIQQNSWQLVSLIAPSATLGLGCSVGDGVFVGQQAHIGPMASIEEGCIINTGAVVEHEAVVGDYCHVSINAVIAGRARIGSKVFIGAGATVLDGLSIAEGVTIGGGCLVNHSILEAGVYVGVPARLAHARTF